VLQIFSGAKYCSQCGLSFDRRISGARCAADGAPLVTLENPLESLGRSFEIVELLGAGGFGLIFKAFQKSQNRLVAIKLMHRHLLGREDMVERFKREAAIGANLDHPNVTKVIDYGLLPGGEPFLIMELLDGCTLAELLRKQGSLPIDAAMVIFNDALKGLQCIHEAGIVHRDLKPSNIFVCDFGAPSCRAKLMDLGLARTELHERDGNKLTQSGVMVGTPAYMSPEVFMGLQPDARSDLYSLGFAMYETLTGIPATEGEIVRSRLYKGANSSIDEYTYALDPEVIAILKQALDTDPERRFQSAAQMRERLEQLSEKLSRERSRGRVSIYTNLAREILRHQSSFDDSLRGPRFKMELLTRGASFAEQGPAAAARALGVPRILAVKNVSLTEGVDIRSIAEETASLFRGIASSNNTSLMVYVQPNVPCAIAGNAILLRRVLHELIDNAVRETAGGEVTVAVEWTTADGDTCLRLAVTDNGRPLKASDTQTAFEPFAMPHSDGQRLGVGLVIVRSLARLMNAEVRCELGSSGLKSFVFQYPQPALRASTPSYDGFSTSAQIVVLTERANVKQTLTAYLGALRYRAVFVTSQADLPQSAPYILIIDDDVVSDRVPATAAVVRLSAIGTLARAETILAKPVHFIELVRTLWETSAKMLSFECGQALSASHTNEPGAAIDALEQLAVAGFDIAPDADINDADTIEAQSQFDQTAPLALGGSGLIDFTKLEQECGAETAHELVASFLTTATNLQGHIVKAVEKKQGKPLQVLCHQLSSAANAIGAAEMFRLCIKLQHASDVGDYTEATLLASALKVSVDRLSDILQQQTRRASVRSSVVQAKSNE
jgi:serine/threonine protein kinase